MAKQMQFNEVQKVVDRVVETSIENLMHSAMIPYSEYVILDRALPRVEDGLKPVQRRILYTMSELGLTPDKPFKKSARIVGDCLGKYHPHGDSSVYGAMVRLAQSFNMSMPLVQGHGNYGSVDGDSAAAMRYTEARLSPLALELLRDLDKDTVNWALNFDDTMKEPQMLPSRYPNLLVNGASGIAIGLATNIPPHCLSEVIDGTIAMIDKPEMELSELMTIIKGPDFPTGGMILGTEGLKKAYETGAGKIRIRAKVDIEKIAGGKHQLVITEIPYQLNKSNLLTSIANLKDTKNTIFNGIQDVVDESDRNGMRAVIKLRKDVDPQMILNGLFKKTKLEVSFGINMVAIADGRPQLMGIQSILKYYIEYQRNVIFKRTQFDLNAARKREEVLSGLMIAIQNIDEVIEIIKKSKSSASAKVALKKRFALTEIQAVAILDMKLSRLTNLEIKKLEDELSKLRKLIKKLAEIVKSKTKQLDIVKKEMSEIKTKYFEPRRTKMLGDEEIEVAPVKDTTIKIARTGMFVLSKDGLVKVSKEKSYQLADKSLEAVDNNSIPLKSIPLNEKETIIAFTNLGNCVKIDLDSLPDSVFKDRGQSLGEICNKAQDNEKIIDIYTLKENMPETPVIFFTKNGIIKKSLWTEYVVSKNYFQAIVLKNDDEIINVEEEKPNTTIFFTTREGMCLNALSDDIPVQGRRSQGVKGIQLLEGDEVIYASQIDGLGDMIVVTDKGFAKKVICATIEVTKRYRKGVNIVKLSSRNGSKVVFSSYVFNPYDIALFDDKNKLIKVNTEDIPIGSKLSSGRKFLSEDIVIDKMIPYFTKALEDKSKETPKEVTKADFKEVE